MHSLPLCRSNVTIALRLDSPLAHLASCAVLSLLRGHAADVHAKTLGVPGPSHPPCRVTSMQAPSHRHKSLYIPLGERRGISDLAHFALDLTGARADSESAALLGDYPSPPMSGSPHIPPKTTQEAGDRSQGTYQTTSQDVYRGLPTTQGDVRLQASTQGVVRPYTADTPERMPFSAYPHPEAAIPRPLSYTTPQGGQMLSQHSYLPGPGPGPAAPIHPPVSTRPVQEQAQTSPKWQRKTKGHVASACVPCKRAHLR